ncbi:cytochrome P450 [Armillaria luteobubalina]|uniref:Cytochrome P450 n=1 Tax=Armillaria luteobubalina TaxID=153913 RepID=A0AA39UJL9_9AGAR|nr:cytochrome P450 [Armillaria luteobubalina]
MAITFEESLNIFPGTFEPARPPESKTARTRNVSLTRFGKVYVVVGRYDAAVELIEKGGTQTSDRPRAIAASDTFSGGLRYAGSVILTLTYGKTTPATFEDPDLQDMIRDGNRCLWSVHSRQWCEGVEDVPECFATDLLDNTAAALVFVINIMAPACLPEAAKVVQKDIGDVVPRDRRPTFEDREKLPQVIAFVYECFRWYVRKGCSWTQAVHVYLSACTMRTNHILGIAHAASQDIIWEGYMIRKGSTIIASPWSIFRSPDLFPGPEDFDSQRWIVDG